MKRRNNSELKPSSWGFYQSEGLRLSDLFIRGVEPQWLIDGTKGRRQVLVGKAIDREWFYQEVEGWTLTAYSHPTRTGVYQNSAGHRVTVQRAENWLSEFLPLQFEAAQNRFAREFGFGFLSSPTLTGLYAIESQLPYGLPNGEPSSDWRSLLRVVTTQGRSEFYGPKLVKGLFDFDRRFAYAADATLDLPCGLPIVFYPETTSEVAFGRSDMGIGYDFQGNQICEPLYNSYECAWYSIEFEVPENWAHVGLLPVYTDRWEWPRVAGLTWRTVVAEPELRVALKAGWQVKVFKKWLFEKRRPLEKPVKKLVRLFEKAKDEGAEVEAGIYRKIVLQAIGAMYSRSFERERIIDGAEFYQSDDVAMLSAEDLGGDRFAVKDYSESRGSRFYAPEWTAYIWSRARARVASEMLMLPFDSLVACHVDSIVTNGESSVDSAQAGKIGGFRLKREAMDFGEKRIENRGQLEQLLQGGE